MVAKWLMLACLAAGALALPATPAAYPMVVTRVDGDNPATEAGPAAETTTAALPRVKLTELDVRSEVSMRYARTAVVAHVRNPAARSQETVFRVLLPETAFISGFQMTLDNVTYKAYVKDKEEAKQIYNQAVSQGVGAAHVAANVRDSSEFVLHVNVEPNARAVFNLTYEELLERRNGVYNHQINLMPGALVPALSVTVRVREAQEITTLRVPALRTGNEVDATDADPINTGAVIVRSADNREATITFKPDLAEQERLMSAYMERKRQPEHEISTEKEGVLGQFVVQYDVKRPTRGDILVNDGYFVHFFAPEHLPPLAKLVVFALDTSGSMMGRKIEQLRQAMRAIIAQLNPKDYFSIVEFQSEVKVHDLKEADQEPQKPSNDPFMPNPFVPNSRLPFDSFHTHKVPAVLVPPFSATKENIEKAKFIVDRLRATGGTDIAGALDVAINIAQKGVGQPGDNEERQELESIIVFLTDGEATVGETDPRRILARVAERNAGPRRASIFSLAFGEGADRALLRKLSLRNSGFMRHIYEAADAALQMGDFYRQISSPLLADVTFTYPPDQVKEQSLTKKKFRTFYAGGEVVVAGRVQPAAAELTPVVGGFCGADDGVGKKRYEISPRVPVERKSDALFPLERLWVYLTVRQLLDQKDAGEESGDVLADDPVAKAKALALQYELVTPLTSLVVVKPNASAAVDARPLDAGDQLRPVYQHQYLQTLAHHGGHMLYAHAHPPAFSSSLLSRNPSYSSYPHSTMLSAHRSFYLQPGLPGPPSAVADFSAPAVPLSTPAVPLSTPAAPPSTPAAPPADPLAPYHLQDYPWTRALISANSDQLTLNVNGTTVSYKITKNEKAPRGASDDACALSTDGGAGACVYLTRCAPARALSAAAYAAVRCAVDVSAADSGYAGVCCPAGDVAP